MVIVVPLSAIDERYINWKAQEPASEVGRGGIRDIKEDVLGVTFFGDRSGVPLYLVELDGKVYGAAHNFYWGGMGVSLGKIPEGGSVSMHNIHPSLGRSQLVKPELEIKEGGQELLARALQVKNGTTLEYLLKGTGAP